MLNLIIIFALCIVVIVSCMQIIKDQRKIEDYENLLKLRFELYDNDNRYQNGEINKATWFVNMNLIEKEVSELEEKFKEKANKEY